MKQSDNTQKYQKIQNNCDDDLKSQSKCLYITNDPIHTATRKTIKYITLIMVTLDQLRHEKNVDSFTFRNLKSRLCLCFKSYTGQNGTHE